MIGGIAGEKVGSGTGKDLAVITGTTAGAIIGYYLPVKIGEHNGFQITVKLDNVPNPTSVIQGVSKKEETKPLKVGQRIAIIYGATILKVGYFLTTSLVCFSSKSFMDNVTFLFSLSSSTIIQSHLSPLANRDGR